MDVYFSTVVRTASPEQGGELVRLDWDTKRVRARVPVKPVDPVLDDPNPRGNSRGGRGVAIVGDEVIVASYHTLHVFDRSLVHKRDIQHPLFVGLHETFETGRGTLWVTSTAIDAALEIDLDTDKVVREFWPREMEAFQLAFDLVPLEIDKNADNRARFLDGSHVKHPSHIHLNAVTELDGEVLAFFNRFGAVVSLSEERVVAKRKALRGGHNLIVERPGRVRANDTLGRRIYAFDVESGERSSRIRLLRESGLAPWARRMDRVFWAKQWLHDHGLQRMAPPRPLFVRGLALRGDRLWVGCSPATIFELDARTGERLDAFHYRRDVRCCIHGLEVAVDGPTPPPS
jgi:hypothetical protein